MTERILLRRDARGRWSWTYVDAERGIELHSNEDFAGERAARRSAATSYPRIPMEVAEVEEAAGPSGPRPGALARLAAVALVAAAWWRSSRRR